MKKLSNYTHSRYCSDEADLIAGIEEVREAIRQRNRDGKKIPYYYYLRLDKLNNKLDKLNKRK